MKTTSPKTTAVSSGPQSYQGYECLMSLPHEYECPICQSILCQPLQIAKCGHRFCANCLQPVLRQEPPLCPLDRDVIEVEKVFTDQACHRAIQGLVVKCPQAAKGCEWTGEIRAVQDHSAVCQRQPVACVNGCDTKLIPREEMDDHIKNTCPLAVVDCPFSNVGCTYKVKRSGLNTHLQDEVQAHLDMTSSSLTAVKLNNHELVASVEACLKRVTDMENRLEQLERAPSKHDGKFMWKISNYGKKLIEAKDGTTPYLFSDVFYTGRYGYNLQICVALNGDGVATNEYISVYIKLARGSCDALLPWPFKQKIKFFLMHQIEEFSRREHVVSEIIPDVTLEGYKRPGENPNPGVGIWRFASHEKVYNKGFLIDDAIFIKCEVEPYDILSHN